ncbi:MAG: AAA family ATPase [Ignavibacteriae bacterium]|nr:AAA family ATPase [Ignavibacteriota bacterium]
MRILELYIKKYKLLEEFKIEFPFDQSTTVLIGKNGSGKTTVIECLTEIFSGLFEAKSLKDLINIKFPFEFEIRYILRKEKNIETSFYGNTFVDSIGVFLSSSHNRLVLKLHYENKVYETLEEIEKFLSSFGETYRYIFPDNLIVYYSGISEILSNNFKKFQKKIILGSLDGEIKTEQPYFYFFQENLPVILIGLLSFQFGNMPKILERKFSIFGFNLIEIKIRKPSWAKPRISSNNFWGARGDLLNFLEMLKVSSGKKEFNKENITFSIQNDKQLNALWVLLGSEKRLFEYLVTLQANDLIESINIALNKNEIIVPHQRLSEGEKQLLTIMGLSELMAAENSLFLLDEPATYLHPEWQRDFASEFLSSDENEKNYFLITSHSPNIVSGLKKEQLKILYNNGGKTSLREFSFNPYGKTNESILIDFFDIEGTRFLNVEEDIKKLQSLIKENKYDSYEYKELFKTLEEELGNEDSELFLLKLEIAKRKNEKNR